MSEVKTISLSGQDIDGLSNWINNEIDKAHTQRANEVVIDLSGCQFSQPLGQVVAIGVFRAGQLNLGVSVRGFSSDWPNKDFFGKNTYPT